MFESILAQDSAVHQLKKALDNPVNTYAFYGSRGTYIEEAARIFAARLIDSSGSSDKRVTSSQHADVIEFEPTGVSYRVKEDVRGSILGEFRKSPIEASRKVLIIHDAHLLREDSANTLLKSLEEPPENLFWILLAPSPDALISTIRSRSFAINFARLDNDTVSKALIEQGINEARAIQVAPIASGRLDRAKKLANEYWPLRELADDIVANFTDSASYIAGTVERISGAFEEISSDIATRNKTTLNDLKIELKDSGYSDKIIQSIITTNKNNFEAAEKRLKNELMAELLDALQYSFSTKAQSVLISEDNLDASWMLFACRQIETYKKRLLFNPSESLFFESLLASISLNKVPLNS